MKESGELIAELALLKSLLMESFILIPPDAYAARSSTLIASAIAQITRAAEKATVHQDMLHGSDDTLCPQSFGPFGLFEGVCCEPEEMKRKVELRELFDSDLSIFLCSVSLI